MRPAATRPFPWHPLRLAEDFATVDILTGGRIVFGVGRGYHTREIETFGSPLRDQKANRAPFEEQVDIIFNAFNNVRFSHHPGYGRRWLGRGWSGPASKR